MNSKRTYTVAICEFGYITAEGGNDIHVFTHPSDNAYEWQYAGADMIDDILDLKPGESLYFQPNRDDKSSKGIILRTA